MLKGPRQDIINAMAKLQSQTTSGTATFNQHALAAALNGDQAPVEAMRREFERRAEYMHQRLNGIKGITCVRPTGAFYAFPNVEAVPLDADTLADRLLEEAGVALLTGGAFGAAGENHLRVSYAASRERLAEGLERMGAFLAAL